MTLAELMDEMAKDFLTRSSEDQARFRAATVQAARPGATGTAAPDVLLADDSVKKASKFSRAVSFSGVRI